MEFIFVGSLISKLDALTLIFATLLPKDVVDFSFLN